MGRLFEVSWFTCWCLPIMGKANIYILLMVKEKVVTQLAQSAISHK